MSARKKTVEQVELPVEPSSEPAISGDASAELAITEMQTISTALVKFDKVAAGMAALKDRYQGIVYPVQTTQGLADARKARGELREVRLNVESIRKDAKAPLLEIGRKLDTAAKRITAELEGIEEPIAEQIDAEDARKEAIRKEKEEAERRRAARILEMIATIRDMPIPARALKATAADIEVMLEAAHNTDIGPEYMEFSGTASEELVRSVQALTALLTDQREREAVAEGLRVEREELNRAKAAQEARAEVERQAIAKLRQEEETRARAERLRVENEQRAAREVQDKADSEARTKRDIELAAVQEQLRREREVQDRQVAEQQRILRERQDAIDRQESESRAKRDAEVAAAQETLRRERKVQEHQAAETRRQQEAEARRLADERAAWEAQQEAVRIAAMQPEPPVKMPGWLTQACEQIDAGVFSGDTFEDGSIRSKMCYYMGRWQRAFDVIDDAADTNESPSIKP